MNLLPVYGKVEDIPLVLILLPEKNVKVSLILDWAVIVKFFFRLFNSKGQEWQIDTSAGIW